MNNPAQHSGRVRVKWVAILLIAVGCLISLRQYLSENYYNTIFTSFRLKSNGIHPERTDNGFIVPAGRSDSGVLETRRTDDLCSRYTLESTNLKQLQHVLGQELNKNDVTLDMLKDYQVTNFTLRNHTCHPREWKVTQNYRFEGGIVMTIEERDCGLPSLGGSSFKVVLDGSSFLTACPVEDYFNGTYHVICCYPSPECANITMQIMFEDFMAFKRLSLGPMSQIIWQEIVCLSSAQPVASYRDDCNGLDLAENGFWRKHGKEKKWERDGCTISRLSNETKVKYLKEMSHINIHGDSHMRYTFHYFTKLRDLLTSKTPFVFSNRRVENMYFSNTRFASDVSRDLDRYLKDKTIRTRKDVLIMNAGAWDVHFNQIHQFARGILEVSRKLALLRNSKAWRNGTIIWVTTIAFPEMFVTGPRRNLHNNYMSAAFNGWIRDKIREVGIPLVDMYRFTFPRTEENVCDKHFLCWDQKLNVVYGDVGISVVDAIFHIMEKSQPL